MKKRVEVAVGLLRRMSDGCILIAERGLGRSYAGYWEFPGGKFESGESAEAALFRELEEEIGVGRSALFSVHSLPHFTWSDEKHEFFMYPFLLDLSPDFRPGPLEAHSAVSFIDPKDASHFRLLPSNMKILVMAEAELRARNNKAA